MAEERDRKHAGRRGVLLLSAVTVAAAMALVPVAGSVANGSVRPPGAGLAPAPATALGPGPFVTLLFSRSEISAADNCVQDDTNIARLDTVVAPGDVRSEEHTSELQSLTNLVCRLLLEKKKTIKSRAPRQIHRRHLAEVLLSLHDTVT